MSIVNINYRGRVLEPLDRFNFQTHPPIQCIIRDPSGITIVIFPSGKCRLMGVREPIVDLATLSVRLLIDAIQSVTITYNMGTPFCLRHLAATNNVWYEPELFPALRLLDFKPLCVNVFASGSIVITGLQTLQFSKKLQQIIDWLKDRL